MGKCPCCDVEIKKVGTASSTHLVVAKTPNDEGTEIHVHGDIENKAGMKELLENAAEEIGIHLGPAEFDRSEVVFRNKQKIGDMLMFTCAVRDFKLAFPDVRLNVVATAQHIFDFNPYLDRSLKPTKENTVMIGPKKLTNASNRRDWHFANAYRVSAEDALHVHIPQGESRPDIYFTQEEYDTPRIFPEPYWIISLLGEKGWGCKMYPFARWQEFVNQNPDVKFVQVGTREDNAPRLQGSNVVDYVGKTQDRHTGIRDLFKLFLNAEGSIGLVSFHMHLSGALKKPAIVVAGAREPVSFTRYAGHKYLETEGALPCAIVACWHCNIITCSNLKKYNDLELDSEIKKKVLKEGKLTAEEKAEFERVTKDWVPMCVDLIVPEDLSRALNQYYAGGRLKKGVPCAKPKTRNNRGPINVVPTPAQPPVYGIPEPPKVDVSKYGMSFGGGSLTDRDWGFLQETIARHKVKTILEFGAGLSTLLMNDLPGVSVITYETNERWIQKIKGINPKCDIRPWDGVDIQFYDDPAAKPVFDFCFVDGPAGDKARERSTAIAASVAKVVIIHDAGREWARKYQDQYFVGKFQGPGKGGHRCHLWEKEGAIASPAVCPTPALRGDSEQTPSPAAPDTPKPPEGIQAQKKGKFIKVVSTARGWGGCARSVTTIMSLLMNAGHTVEFIPFRNKVASREFQECIKKDLSGLIVTETYDTLREACDVLLVYADDFIWEFKRPEIVEAFSDVNAARKIMMLNYRRGAVGEIPWTRGWDKYMFLNSTQERELLKVLPGVNTKVLPPCTDLSPFFNVSPKYNTNLRIVRHSSQGDTKYEKLTFGNQVIGILEALPRSEIMLMPGPSFMPELPGRDTQDRMRFRKFPRNKPPVPEFLGQGNVFWYSLPAGPPRYMDMGPRVILEAMAAGLPIVADNWGGVVDRIGPPVLEEHRTMMLSEPFAPIECECGFLCNTKEEHVEVINEMVPWIRQRKGMFARDRAREEFVPENWLRELLS